MLKVLSAEQMREIDRLTVDRYGIPSIILMENAAHAVVRAITEKLGGSVQGKSVLVLCGPGNNGGDGAAVARQLGLCGAYVDAVVFGRIVETKGDARMNLGIVAGNDLSFEDKIFSSEFCDIREITSKEEWDRVQPGLYEEPDCIVDAIFGTGLSRPLDNWIYNIIHEMNFLAEAPSAKRPLRVAVDIPSGLNADTGRAMDVAVEADITVTFTAAKPGNVLPGAASLNGELVIANIGSTKLVDEQESQLFLADEEDVCVWLEETEFTNSSYKNKRGHALIIGGSRNYSGAAVLAGNAAIRSGVGLVTIATPEDSRDGVIGRVVPEVMVRGISQTEDGSASERAADELAEFLEGIDCIAIGSGLSSKEDETKNFVRRMIRDRETPVVVDADAITALSPWQTTGGDQLPLILTPHEGEFRKMLGLDREQFDEVIADRVKAVRDFATKFRVILVLKGERALIGAPDGRVVVNPTGNSGLGKAGNGDTLTGIIAGFVAQAAQMNIDLFETVVAAVYVAGMAGDLAAQKFGKRAMTASDVKDCLVEVFEEFEGR